MKKILILMALIATISNAGLFSAVSGMSMDEVKPTSEYTIDTAGIDPRVYEFTPRNLKNTVCVLVFSSSNESSTSSMECRKVEK